MATGTKSSFYALTCMGPQVRFQPSARCGLSLLLVLALLQRFFFSGFSGFPPSTKTNIFKFQFDQVRHGMYTCKAVAASSLNIVI